MNTSLLAIVLVSICCCANGQMFGIGKCPQPTTQENFDINRYLGVWHEVMRYPFVIFELGTRCTRANYTDQGEGVYGVHNSAYSTRWRTYGEIDEAFGTAVVVDPEEPAKLYVSFDEEPNREPEEASYWVVATDYENYSVVWSCVDYSLFHADILWVLARTPEIEDELKEDLRQMIVGQGLRAHLLRDQDQSCFIDEEEESMESMEN